MTAGGRCQPVTPRLSHARPAVAAPPPGRARRYTRWLAASLAAVPLLALAAAFLTADPGDPAFDSVVWRAQAGVVSGNRRFGMIADLEASKLRPGMTREEVYALLGPPESSRPGRDTWELGIRFFGMDHESYDVRYGPDGRVTGFGQVQG